jgi:hypothetical protein
MKLEMMFAAVSLILVVGIIAIAIPSQAQAAAKHKDQAQGQWCYTSAVIGAVCGFDTMVDCKHSADSAGPSVSYCGKALMSNLP